MILTGSDKASGRIAAFGSGVNEWQVCGELLELGELDVFLLAGLHTLLEQEALDTFVPMCQARDVGIILGGGPSTRAFSRPARWRAQGSTPP